MRPDPARTGGRLLLLDGVESSYVDVDHPAHLEFEYLRNVARLVDHAFPRAERLRVVQIGGGPCALARYLQATRRDVHCHVIERDARVIAAANAEMGLVESAAITITIGDGRDVVRDISSGSTDVLVVDAFVGALVPHHLTTAEFTSDVRRVLRSNGLHLVNVIDLPPLEYASAIVATLAGAYRRALLMADPAVLGHRSSGNLVAAGSDRALTPPPGEDGWRTLQGRGLRRATRDAALLRDGSPAMHGLGAVPRWGTAPTRRRRETGR